MTKRKTIFNSTEKEQSISEILLYVKTLTSSNQSSGSLKTIINDNYLYLFLNTLFDRFATYLL